MNKLLRFERPHPAEVDEAYHALNIGNIANVLYWKGFFEIVRNVPGAIVECGVGRGRSLLICAALNEIFAPEQGGRRAVFGYDSFEGFPQPSREDDSPRQPHQGEWARSPSGLYTYSPDFIACVLANGGIETQPTLGKGFFCSSLKSYPGDPIAILHVDCDLYQSYLDTLQALWDMIVVGGVVVFDDFLFQSESNEDWPGARRAVSEFFADKNQTMHESIRGTPYIIKA